MTASIISFGLLAATSTGLAAVHPEQELIGHEFRTSGYNTFRFLRASNRTSEASLSSALELARVREISGMTWDQIAKLFGVSRRAVHHWASGDNMNAHNYEFLAAIGSTLDQLSGDGPAEKKAQLFQTRPGGSIYETLRKSVDLTQADLHGPRITASALLGVV
jgi:DNA-binding transcriptional regulator YiaG